MNWYQVKVRLERTQQDGTKKKVSEEYLVQAFSFSIAEQRVQEEVAPTAQGEFDIVAVARKNFSEIITSKLGSEIADKWYKCKINFITIDEVNGKEKKTSSYFLVQSSSALTAHKSVDEFMRDSMSDYEVEQVDETKILEVFKIASKDEE